ncbi:MAG: hypothetical protein JWN44_3608 [Myxococcales bacterium]|nr:hypothetical protein [Myxococcales bacterium]
MKCTLGVAAMFVLSAVGSQLSAQETPQPAAPKVKVERSASGQKIFRITEGIVVEGKIQKPNAFYVLQRSSMDYDWESLKQDFLPKILQAASKHPF